MGSMITVSHYVQITFWGLCSILKKVPGGSVIRLCSSYSDSFTVFNIFKFCFCHLQLVPLFVFVGGGTVISVLYLARLGLRNPDVW